MERFIDLCDSDFSPAFGAIVCGVRAKGRLGLQPIRLPNPNLDHAKGYRGDKHMLWLVVLLVLEGGRHRVESGCHRKLCVKRRPPHKKAVVTAVCWNAVATAVC